MKKGFRAFQSTGKRMSEIKNIPGSGVTIQPAVLRDFKAIYQMERICFKQDAWPLLDILGVLTIPQVIRLKAVEGDKLIGFIAADLRRSQGTAWIATLAVLPSYRRKGVGAALLRSCEDQISLPRVRLSVRKTNYSAIQLYLKSGYQQVDIWKSYYRGGDDALIFEKIPEPEESSVTPELHPTS